MNQEDLNKLAREAGAAGRRYSDFAASDELWNAHEALGGDVDSEAMQAAYSEGRREHRAAKLGWKSLWTTAPEGYDTFGTETAERCGEWFGKSLRRVLVDPAHVGFQGMRYGSGNYPAWEEDPRVEEARRVETLTRERAELKAFEERRAEGLVWIRTVEDAALVDDDFDVGAHGLRWEDLRDEKRRRRDEKEAAERAEKWARCRASFKDGDTLVDPGCPSKRVEVHGVSFSNPGRDPAVYRACAVKPHYLCAEDADLAVVAVEGDERVGTVGSLENVAGRLAKGELRVAGPGEVFPPRAVVDRLGCRYTEVVRVEAEGRVAWVGRARFGFEPIVLDDAGHLVRAKKIREAGERALRERDFAPRAPAPGGAP